MITPFLTSCCSTGSQDFDQTTLRCIIEHLLLMASVTITRPFFQRVIYITYVSKSIEMYDQQPVTEM